MRLRAAALLALLAAPEVRADRVRLLDDPRESMLARAELIDGAKQEILAQSFILGDDRITFGVLALLRDAARRGVKVRILADAQWNHVPGSIQAHLIEQGVEIREFHPFRIDRLHWVARRMHDKMMVVDGRVVLVGGRNVEAPYFGDGAEVDRRNYVDCDVEAETPEATHARDYFGAVWGGNQVEVSRHPRFPEDRDRAGLRLDEAESWLRAQLDSWRKDDTLAPGSFRDVESVRFIHDPAGQKGEPGTAAAILGVLASARRSVVAESPYLVPSRSLKEALAAARKRGASVRILTNSLASTDNLWPQAAYAGDRKPLVRRGIELWEQRGPDSLHAKTMVVDGERSVVGSFNLNPRSEELDTEVAVLVEDAGFAAELEASMQRHLANAWRIGTDGRPENETARYPDVSRAKIWRMQIRRLVTPLLHRQL